MGTGTRRDGLIAGKYRLERVLGQGGMGVVHAAEHVDLQKPVAIKILRDELTAQVELVERMLTEARTVARLRSEHVAVVIDVGRLENGAPFIVMEYLDGCDLGTHLCESGRLSVEVAVDYVLQACEAVAEAHAAGIVHRDLKPENLFLSARTDGEPIVKVLDFGISRNMQSGEREPSDGLIAGSPDYMAPESMRLGSPIGPAADIWSIGAVLYELFTGQRPFEGDTVSETCTRVLSSPPVAPRHLEPTIQPALQAVVLRCLRKDPGERFASVVELAKALAPFGGEGAFDQARRIERVAAGGRWSPHTAKRANVVSFSDLPNSTSAVVSGPAESDTSAAMTPPPRSRWHVPVVAVVIAAAAAAAGFTVVEREPAPSAVAAAVAVAPAPATATAAGSANDTPAASAKANASVARATASPAPPPKLEAPRWKPMPTTALVASSATASAMPAEPTYEDEPPTPPPPPASASVEFQPDGL
jgi:eukaryotic-like serine/threonine-protein kinase